MPNQEPHPIEQTKKELLQKLQSPQAALTMLFDQATRHDETVQFFIAKIRSVQELVGQMAHRIS